MKAPHRTRVALIAAVVSSIPLTVRADPSFQIIQNGSAHGIPRYPYVGHKYNYERVPGDNDMPWLRQFAIDHGIFDKVDMTLDWKDREFDMMKAIVWYTSHHLSWTGENSIPNINHRAKTLLQANEQFPDMHWICEDIAFTAVGLAQAFGIPARVVGGRSADFPPNADNLVEMYSTRYNRWILFFQKCYGWIEHKTLGPMGLRELQTYNSVEPIQVNLVHGVWIAQPHSVLDFLPSPLQIAPIAPYYSETWMMGLYGLLAYTARTDPNGNYPECCPVGSPSQYLVTDDLINQQNDWLGWGCCQPIVPMNDPDGNYPLNNVEGAVLPSARELVIRLRHNMFEFVRFESKIDNEAWRPMPVLGIGGGLWFYIWQPRVAPATLSIRGVTIAGVHSPDVVIRVTSLNGHGGGGGNGDE